MNEVSLAGLRRKVTLLKSQVDRLDGKIDALIEAAGEQGKRIRKLEDKQRMLGGLRSHLS